MTRTSRLLLTTAAIALGASIIAGVSLADGQGGHHHGGGDYGGGPHGGFGPGITMYGGGPHGGFGPAIAMLEELDSNGDGKVTQAEIDQARAERFAEIDRDGNGLLDLEEYEALWLDAMRPRMVDRFQDLDEDGNAGVTAAEFGQPLSSMLSRLDDDDDGEISAEELRERQGHRGRRHHEEGDDD